MVQKSFGIEMKEVVKFEAGKDLIEFIEDFTAKILTFQNKMCI